MAIDPRQFLSEAEELHALVIGACEILCPFPPRHPTMTHDQAAALVKEYHYYMLGRALGILAWIPICGLIKAVFF